MSRPHNTIQRIAHKNVFCEVYQCTVLCLCVVCMLSLFVP